MSAPVKLRPLIKRSLEKLMDLGEAQWPDFACWTIPGANKPLRQHTVNVIRHLKRAGYVEDITKKYTYGGKYTGPRLSAYRLTQCGVRAVISGNKESA